MPVIDDLEVTVHLVFVDSVGNKYTDPAQQIGSIIVDYIYITKEFRLETVTTAGVVSMVTIPEIPTTNIDAFTEVIIPDYPLNWSSPSPGPNTPPVNTLFHKIVSTAQYGNSNPPTEHTEPEQVYDPITGLISYTGHTHVWYTGTNNGVTSQAGSTYTLPNYIYNQTTQQFDVQTATQDHLDFYTSEILIQAGDDFIHQPGIDETLLIYGLGYPLEFKLELAQPLQVGAWYCVDVFGVAADATANPIILNGTWSPSGVGRMYVSDVCNTNLLMNPSGNLDWGAGGANDIVKYPVGHMGRITETDTIATTAWYGGPGNGENILRRSIQLEHFKPNVKDSTESGGTWTLADGNERNNIDTRTYGSWSNDGSYRAIFQLHPNSHKAKSNLLDDINIMFDGASVAVSKITIAKIQNPSNTLFGSNDYGTMQSLIGPSLLPTISSSKPWITENVWRGVTDGGYNAESFRQGLQDPKVYFKKNSSHPSYGGLNFDTNIYEAAYDSSGVQNNKATNAAWYYHFLDNTTITDPTLRGSQNSPQTSIDGWEFSFSVNAGLDKFGVPRTNTEGSFGGYVTNTLGSAPSGLGDMGGFEFNNIAHVGHYKIKANMDNTGLLTSQGFPYEVLIKEPGAVDYVDYIGINPDVTINSVSLPFMSLIQNEAQIKLSGEFVGAVDNVSLKDQTNLFTGGTINAWQFSGFDTVNDNFIFFDNSDPTNPSIGFENAPPGPMVNNNVSPPALYDTPVQLQQVVPTIINTGDSLLVEFQYHIVDGQIDGYYFNAAGNGFRIGPLNGVGFYSQLHTVGTTTPAMTSTEYINTFVIFVSSGFVNGSIDNLSMVRQIQIEPRHLMDNPDENPDKLSPTTLSYNEGVKGWVSFKSFVPDQALSLAKKYYTINSGALYEHHATHADRNSFYNTFIESSLTAVFNQEPSTVKMFNTLNYEGSQSKINEYLTDQGLSNIDTYNTTAKDGWYVNYIQTDKQSGSIGEFVEKEGKWFNYIKGDSSAEISTAEFSFQGLGRVLTVTLDRRLT